MKTIKIYKRNVTVRIGYKKYPYKEVTEYIIVYDGKVYSNWLAELSAILNKSKSLISMKLNGKIDWYVDEIKALYDVLGDEAWDIYMASVEKQKENKK